MSKSTTSYTMLQPETLTLLRTMFPHTALKRNYLNHAATSPMSSRIMNIMTAYFIERSSGVLDNYVNDLPKVAECRMLIRRLINAEGTDRIAFVPNTSEALNIVASGLPWKTGDRILLNNLEFPANVYPYLHLKRHGVEIDMIEGVDGTITPDRIEAALTPKTRLVGLSAVQYLSGFRADLEAIGSLLKSKGILFVVDAIQAIGAVQIDVQQMKIDALASGGHKWQMSPQGTGYLYLTHTVQERIKQQYLGWLSVEDPWHFNELDQPPASGARRYEGGTLNVPGIWGMHTALTTLLDFGMNQVEQQILGLTRELIDGFQNVDGVTIYSPLQDEHRAGIVTINIDDVNAKNVFAMLSAQNISTGLRQGKIRYSPHFYMTLEEMQGAIDATRECIGRSAR